MIVIDNDRVDDLHVLRRPAHVIYVFLKGEFGRMDADHDQTMVLVFVSPRAHIRKLTPPGSREGAVAAKG